MNADRHVYDTCANSRVDIRAQYDEASGIMVERMESSLVEGFLEADKGALELMSLPGAVYSGSTAVSVAIVPADQATVLICANAGDCRAGVCQCT